ncbi:enoyl-CoA hydratase-related protein [Pararhodobacter zhoushanensis]|uniref:enoyl-CoA hydratase-related protein n=1 Tax=Pararhodobacter zhoushanensis TaxID=2479545 RepID=UPI000F8C85E5|nr:enoyl-CoA hydratase-related protein [Pararhodobacter zhoushanensis]
MAPFEHIRLTRDGAIARLTLNRPARLNALIRPMQAELSAALDLLEAEPPQVLILTGEGRGFCAGQDLTERYPQIAAGEAVHLGASLTQTYNPLIRRLNALPCVIIAAVNGVAAGAGIGLALTADIILAAREARFLMAFGKVGLGPDAGVSWALPERIGSRRALALALTGGGIDAQTALDWGLVWALHDAGELAAATQELALVLVAGSAQAQRAAKQLLREKAPSLEAALARESACQDALGHTDFYRDAVLAFAAPKPAR